MRRTAELEPRVRRRLERRGTAWPGIVPPHSILKCSEARSRAGGHRSRNDPPLPPDVGEGGSVARSGTIKGKRVSPDCPVCGSRRIIVLLHPTQRSFCRTCGSRWEEKGNEQVITERMVSPA